MDHDRYPRPDRRGPQIYFHLEFGVSWNPRQIPRNHEVTYRSRGLRERSPAFPRQVPAPNTNYLAAIHDFQMRQQREQLVLAQNQAYLSRYHPGYTRAREVGEDGQELRPSRADSRGSHERGRSAPAPFGENPWDVRIVRKAVPPPQNPAEAKAIKTALDNWKPLPGDPSQFRLGEDGMPWYDPSTCPHPADEDDEHRSIYSMSAEGSSRRRSGSGSGSDARVTHPEEVSIFSPDPLLRTQSLPQPPSLQVTGPGGDDSGRKKELEDLGAAMVTVDNGFENQWWNQGQRATVMLSNDADLDAADAHARFSAHSIGWAVASPPLRAEERVSAASLNMISPISASDYRTMSPPSSTFQQLHRTMSTRSEELFFTTPGQRRRRGDSDVSPNTP